MMIKILSDKELRGVITNSIENPTDFTFEVIEALGLNYEKNIAQAQNAYTIKQVMALLEKEYPAITTWQCWKGLQSQLEEG